MLPRLLTRTGRHLPTLALAALVLALGVGTTATAAGLITGKDIKDDTVTSADVKDKTLKVKDLSATARDTLAGAPALVGSGCVVPGTGAGTVEWSVAPNGTITFTCHVVTSTEDIDDDGDGYLRSQECNDNDPAVNPGVTEVMDDFRDNDCDTVADEGTNTTDVDADGQTIAQGDCDDTTPVMFAGNTDPFGDGYDGNCDGVDG